MSARILVVDDDPDILLGLKQRLEWLGHQPLSAKDGSEALDIIQHEAPALVLLDLELPVLSGLEVLGRLRKERDAADLDRSNPAGSSAELTPPIIILTAFGSIPRAVEAMKLGAYDFLTKPFDPEYLGLLIQKVLDRDALRKEVRILRSEVDARYAQIVGVSAKMKEVIASAKRAASGDIAVLLLGETGTGKELLARSIHRWSPRKNKPFMAINCASMPETLLENELFGHERGSFTGATHMQEGKIEAAEGGTVFLDEIGDMPIALQSRLLRLLQDKEFHRIGGTRKVRADVRYIAATNKDLSRAVKHGLFREDLFYRLNVLPITLVPLRERPEDIPLLAEHILEQNGVAHGLERKQLSPCAQEALSHYPWPGNIRELENVLARASILTETHVIIAESLGLPVSSVPRAATTRSKEVDLSYHESMECHSRWLITEALRRSGGNRTRAAALLQLQRTYLTKLLRQKHISVEPADDGPPKE